jgi:hypothetical protein
MALIVRQNKRATDGLAFSPVNSFWQKKNRSDLIVLLKSNQFALCFLKINLHGPLLVGSRRK